CLLDPQCSILWTSRTLRRECRDLLARSDSGRLGSQPARNGRAMPPALPRLPDIGQQGDSRIAALRAAPSHEPPEFQLLLYCARSRPDAGSVRDLVSKGIDWQILLKLAAQHCVRPMLLQTLKSVCWDAVPQKTQLELTLFNEANVQKNLFFTGELLRL